MTRQIIQTSDAPSSPLFSQAVRVASTIYLSGIAGIDPKTNSLAGLTIEEQTRQALINCERILRAAGATFTNVVDVHVLLAQPGDFTGFNEAYAKFFPSDPPTRAVSKLGVEVPNLLVSIKMTAVLRTRELVWIDQFDSQTPSPRMPPQPLLGSRPAMTRSWENLQAGGMPSARRQIFGESARGKIRTPLRRSEGPAPDWARQCRSRC